MKKINEKIFATKLINLIIKEKRFRLESEFLFFVERYKIYYNNNLADLNIVVNTIFKILESPPNLVYKELCTFFFKYTIYKKRFSLSRFYRKIIKYNEKDHLKKIKDNYKIVNDETICDIK